MTLPILNETSCPPGTTLNPYEITYSADQIQQYLDRTGESPEDYTAGGRQLVPPGMLLGAYGRLIHGTFHYEAGVHVSSDMVLHRSPALDETVTVSGNALRLFERNGDRYITFDVLITDRGGERLARIEHTSIYELKPRARG